MTITCTGCAKPFAFDLATTSKSQVQQFSESVGGPNAPKTFSYHPTCPHCKSRQFVTLTERR